MVFTKTSSQCHQDKSLQPKFINSSTTTSSFTFPATSSQASESFRMASSPKVLKGSRSATRCSRTRAIPQRWKFRAQAKQRSIPLSQHSLQLRHPFGTLPASTQKQFSFHTSQIFILCLILLILVTSDQILIVTVQKAAILYIYIF
jgi:hypothetical protein